MTDGQRRRAGVAAAGTLTFLNLYATQGLLPIFADVFGASITRAGLTVTATLAAVAMVAPFVGGISDALGRRRLIVGASVLLVVPVLLSAVAPTLDVVILSRFLQGLVLPFVFAVTVAYVADECDGADAARVTAVYATSGVVGGFLGRFLSGWITAYAGWRAAFVVLAGITSICAVVIAVCLPSERRFKPTIGWRGTLAGFRDQFGNPQVMATCVVGFTVLFSMVGSFTFITLRLAAPPFDLGPAALGSVFLLSLMGVVSAQIGTGLGLRLGRQRAVAAAAILSIAGLLLSLAPSFILIMMGLGLAVAGFFATQVLSLGYVAQVARQARSTAVGLYVTCYYAGGAIGSVAPAGVWHLYGWTGCVAVIIGIQVLAITVTQLVWPRMALP